MSVDRLLRGRVSQERLPPLPILSLEINTDSSHLSAKRVMIHMINRMKKYSKLQTKNIHTYQRRMVKLDEAFARIKYTGATDVLDEIVDVFVRLVQQERELNLQKVNLMNDTFLLKKDMDKATLQIIEGLNSTANINLAEEQRVEKDRLNQKYRTQHLEE